MGDLEDGIKRLIDERYDSQAAFARTIGLRPSTVSSFLSRGVLNSNTATLKAIVEELGLDANAALEGRFALNDDPSKPVMIPMYCSIASSGPEGATAEDYFPLSARLHRQWPEAYMLQVDGNSMNQRFPEGSYLLVNPCDGVDVSGERYVVAIGDAKAMVKQVILHDQGMTLHPESDDPSYESVFYRYDSQPADSVQVMGKVVYSWSPAERHTPAQTRPGN